MKTMGSICLLTLFIGSTDVSASVISTNQLTNPLLDSIQVEREQFQKEYKAKLLFLEGKIEETRAKINKGKKELQEKLTKELDDLAASEKSLSSKLEDNGEKSQVEWEKYTKDIREEYDQTESSVRNFFKK